MKLNIRSTLFYLLNVFEFQASEHETSIADLTSTIKIGVFLSLGMCKHCFIPNDIIKLSVFVYGVYCRLDYEIKRQKPRFRLY